MGSFISCNSSKYHIKEKSNKRIISDDYSTYVHSLISKNKDEKRLIISKDDTHLIHIKIVNVLI